MDDPLYTLGKLHELIDRARFYRKEVFKDFTYSCIRWILYDFRQFSSVHNLRLECIISDLEGEVSTLLGFNGANVSRKDVLYQRARLSMMKIEEIISKSLHE